MAPSFTHLYTKSLDIWRKENVDGHTVEPMTSFYLKNSSSFMLLLCCGSRETVGNVPRNGEEVKWNKKKKGQTEIIYKRHNDSISFRRGCPCLATSIHVECLQVKVKREW